MPDLFRVRASVRLPVRQGETGPQTERRTITVFGVDAAGHKNALFDFPTARSLQQALQYFGAQLADLSHTPTIPTDSEYSQDTWVEQLVVDPITLAVTPQRL